MLKHKIIKTNYTTGDGGESGLGGGGGGGGGGLLYRPISFQSTHSLF